MSKCECEVLALLLPTYLGTTRRAWHTSIGAQNIYLTLQIKAKVDKKTKYFQTYFWVLVLIKLQLACTFDSSFKVVSCHWKLQLCTCEDNKFPSLSWQDIKAEDWSQYVAPFWPAVIWSALTWKGFTSLLRSGKLDNSCGS